jgi:hypothetical protein
MGKATGCFGAACLLAALAASTAAYAQIAYSIDLPQQKLTDSLREPHRGLLFHDEAWHWAMLQTAGPQYWVNRPELKQPSAAYRLESAALSASVATQLFGQVDRCDVAR